MRYRWLPFALLLVSSSAFAQHSNTSLLKYSEALRVNDYYRAGIHISDFAASLARSGNFDSAFAYYNRALEINQKAKNDTMIASNFLDLGGMYTNLAVPDSALAYYLKAIAIYERIGNDQGYAYTKINIATIFKEKGLYERALEYALSAESMLAKYPDDNYLDNCYHSIATIYARIDKTSIALNYYRKAMTLRQVRSETSELAGTLNNIGNLFKDIGSYDSAIYYLERSLAVKRTLPNKKNIASTLTNIGEVLLKLDRIDSAEMYLLESLELKKAVDDKPGLAITLNDLADCNIRTKDYVAAEHYLNRAEEMEQSAGGLLKERKNNLELRVRLNRAIGNYRKASDYAVELSIVKDSLQGTETSKNLAEIQAKFDTEKKEQQIEVLHVEQELDKATIKARNFWITGLVFAIVAMLVIASLIYNSFRIARKGRSRVELLMKELHHRVKNNLQVLSSVISLQSQSLTDENALLSVKSTETRINAMALIHRKLYSDDQNTIVSTRGYFRELIEFLMSSFGYDISNLKVNAEIDEVELDVDKAIPIGLIVNELISNAFKHAYDRQDNRELDIIVKQRGRDLYVVVRDNGIGSLEQNGEESKFGMRMVNILVRDLKGKLQTSVNKGTEHSLHIPLV